MAGNGGDDERDQAEDEVLRLPKRRDHAEILYVHQHRIRIADTALRLLPMAGKVRAMSDAASPDVGSIPTASTIEPKIGQRYKYVPNGIVYPVDWVADGKAGGVLQEASGDVGRIVWIATIDQMREMARAGDLLLVGSKGPCLACGHDPANA